ncbi:MAG TPA: glycosyltransferase family 4 protein, partial [Bacteroidales bacterium]|nr:glycosyltransferase family 4 protein [Bacteroidales bacterium]
IGYNIPLYIYTDSPFLREQSLYRKLKRKLKKYLHFYYFKRDADYYVVQTDDVNQRVRQALDTDQVLTVTNTASSYYTDWTAYPPKLSPKAKGTFRFITISSYYAHKNLELIPEVLRELQSRGITQLEFVLTLKEQDFQTHIGAQPGIINVGPIPPEACPSLYQECDAPFLPTLAECFSASYPEAMAMEKPIVTTDLGFARSICREAALFFDPMNAKSAADQIIQLIRDVELQKDLISKGKRQLKTFDSPRDRAEKYIALCEKLGNNR